MPLSGAAIGNGRSIPIIHVASKVLSSIFMMALLLEREEQEIMLDALEETERACQAGYAAPVASDKKVLPDVCEELWHHASLRL
jgi:hypothetical protein